MIVNMEYQNKSFGQHTIVDKKAMTTFKTFLNFKLSYRHHSQKIKVELPVDNTNEILCTKNHKSLYH